MSSKTKSTSINLSVIQKFKDQNKINDETLVIINAFTIEDLLAIKLELSANNINNRLYGLDIWKKSDYIIKDAMLKFAVSTTKSKKDAARFLGVSYSEFNSLYKRYKLEDFFEQDGEYNVESI
tara:strand:+ start:240 stop:608 length:369 start_codon:yes stop_codon:yes gene_type:complete